MPCHIGTSGWQYAHWKGPFYPGDCLQRNFLDYYATCFSTVEINNSFYKLPTKKNLCRWTDTVTEDFIFSVKASRYITHMKKLKDPGQSLSGFIKVIDILGDRAGVVLFQLPPRWHKNTERLKTFLSALPQHIRYAFEFRDPSWFDDAVYDMLAVHNAAFCIYDLKGNLSPRPVTTDFVYVRLHGPSESAYQGSYSKRQLTYWAEKCRQWSDESKDIYCYFDNDQKGFAAKNALTLQAMLNSQK